MLLKKTFKCEYCEKCFMTSTHLKRHVEKCRIVKIPGDNSHLKEHIIEAFTCDVCSKSFSNSQNLKKHQTRIHYVIKLIRAAINHGPSMLIILPPSNMRQSPKPVYFPLELLWEYNVICSCYQNNQNE